MKIAFYTLGCKVNQYETQVMAELLTGSGHTIVPDTNLADCVVVNSCTVTAESDRKTRQAVRRFKKRGATVVLCGCLSQAFPDSAGLIAEADIVTGNSSHADLPMLIDDFSKNRTRIVSIKPHTRDEKYTTPCLSNFAERTRAFMKIEDGCDRFCTYCAIPKARGFIRSRPLEDIKAEAQRLAEKGFCEIVLVGINLTSYGKEIGLNIADAVRAAASPEGIKRVRLGSLEPDHISDELLSRLKAEKKFCPQFHLALQSGSDNTLKRMNRRYDTAFYRDIALRIKNMFENPALTTDIMVGFAGESEADFEESVQFLREMQFARAHVFAYSRREGTPAASFPGQLTSAEKSRRAAIMASAAAECEKEFLSRQVGRSAFVLFETYKDGVNEGYTENYTRVKVQSGTDLSGKLCKVALISSQEDFCFGTPI